ncbi:hypothetical protein evm_000962 [Chilo suppressalis]|nr:hypothetical protein evm_000962 [Chilo suppressalis]
MYTLVLCFLISVNVNCLYVHDNIDSWPTSPQAHIIAQSRRFFANRNNLAYQIPKQNTVVVVPNSGQIPVARSNQFAYNTNTVSRTPTTVIISQPASY